VRLMIAHHAVCRRPMGISDLRSRIFVSTVFFSFWGWGRKYAGKRDIYDITLVVTGARRSVLNILYFIAYNLRDERLTFSRSVRLRYNIIFYYIMLLNALYTDNKEWKCYIYERRSIGGKRKK